MKNVSPESPALQQAIAAFEKSQAGRHGDGNGPTDTPPTAGAMVGGITIRAPRGIVPVQMGYDLWAVELGETDGEEDILAGAPMSERVDSLKKILNRAIELGQKPELPRGVLATATHLVINDHTGREVYRHGLARKAAA